MRPIHRLLLPLALGAVAAAPTPERAAREAADRLERRAAAAEARAEATLAEAGRIGESVARAEARVAAATRTLARVEGLRVARRGRLVAAREPVARLASALQALARRPAALALLGPGSVDDIVHVRLALAAAVPEISRRTETLRVEIAAADALAVRAAEARAALAEAKAARAVQQAALLRLAAARRSTAERVGEIALTASDRALALSADARDAREAKRIEVEARRLAASLAGEPVPPAGGPAEPAGPRAGWRMPVAGRVVAGFGEAGEGARGRGVTLATTPGGFALAPAPGRIAFAGPFAGYGRLVIIAHPRGWTTILAGLAETMSPAGQLVARGMPIGRTGARTTIEVRHDGRPMDVVDLARRG